MLSIHYAGTIDFILLSLSLWLVHSNLLNIWKLIDLAYFSYGLSCLILRPKPTNPCPKVWVRVWAQICELMTIVTDSAHHATIEKTFCISDVYDRCEGKSTGACSRVWVYRLSQLVDMPNLIWKKKLVTQPNCRAMAPGQSWFDTLEYITLMLP